MTGKTKVAGGGAAAKRAYWGKRITEWEHSGQTQKAFCAQRSLALSTFRWWRTRGREAMKSAAPFLPIAMGAMSAMNVVEVELRSRTRMRFEGEAALQAVAQLVARVK
ncbi:MAG: hypothetical protein Q8O70_03890 [Burkholderiales bacterium]|nr:hypothetical protein [Burkholderiales bacterium]